MDNRKITEEVTFKLCLPKTASLPTGVCCFDGGLSLILTDNLRSTVELLCIEDGSFSESLNLASVWDICLMGNNLYCTDPKSSTVRIIDVGNGMHLRKTHSRGRHLTEPRGIAIDENQIAICDSVASCVYLHDIRSDTVTEVLHGSVLAEPNYVAVSLPHVYVSDAFKNSVYAFDVRRLPSVLWTFGGSQGENNDQLDNPAGIALTESTIKVADNNNNRIVSIQRENGIFLNYDLSWEDGLNEPQAIAIHDNRIFVTESTSRNVKILDFDRPFD
ncbi:unnamed protein product [Dimorphilus gyrociliatus]|uniref:Uncharacterized protein n=1 Tax=Dimorphilus gyrociliatus TaxID=2664684 RepID=A0A7I8VWT8_9ANNE|nr:unnamed protein product [Dimorphilus gyrociliatus]